MFDSFRFEIPSGGLNLVGELSRDIRYDSIWFVFQFSTMFGSGLYGYPFVSGLGFCSA